MNIKRKLNLILKFLFIFKAKENDERPNSLRLQESLPNSIKLEVLSSQSKVTITIDGATVSLEPQ
jgi:hypothetical protein